MNIEKIEVTVGELADGYYDDDDRGAKAYGGKLDARPPYQRNFIYKDKQRNAVIDSILRGLPLNVFYWAKNDDGYEILDGQQRSLSICQFINGDFSIEIDGKPYYFHNLPESTQIKIERYTLDVYVCDGSEEEKLEWFKRINIAGVVLNNQELLNAVYHGPWLSDAKKKFSARNCPAERVAKGYIAGSPIRQDYLETAIRWIAQSKGISSEEYMAKHQHDVNAGELWSYFSAVMEWVKQVFTEYRPEMKTVPWGSLYDEFGQQFPDASVIEERTKGLMIDDEVTNRRGIYEYILTGDERALCLRDFTKQQKLITYGKQNGHCVRCLEEGNDKVYQMNEMDADHIVEWRNGGATTLDNCQLLCVKHNRGDKSWKKRD